jgi:hypothetical protein
VAAKRDSPARVKDEAAGEKKTPGDKKRPGETPPAVTGSGGVKRAKPSPGGGGAQRSLHSFFKKT